MARKRIRVKPGRAQSKIGFFAGLLFCLIGVFMVIPIFGVFGIFWTLMAVIITALSGINAFSDKGMASHEIIIDEESGASESGDNRRKENIESRLRIAEELYREGSITKDELDEKRREILKEI